MKKFLFAVVLLMLPVTLLGQVSATLSTYYDVPKRFIAVQSGGPLDGAYTTGDPDTLQQVEVLGTVIDSIYHPNLSSNKSILRLVVRAVDPFSTRERSYSYVDTLVWNTQNTIPYQDSVGISDSLFHINVADSLAIGDYFRLMLIPIDEVRLPGDSLNVHNTN